MTAAPTPGEWPVGSWASARTVRVGEVGAVARGGDRDPELVGLAAQALGRAGLTALPGEFPGWLVLTGVTDADVDRFDGELRAVGLAVGDSWTRGGGTTVIVYRPSPTVLGADGRPVCPACRGRGGEDCPTCGGLCWLCDGTGGVTCSACEGGPVTTTTARCRACAGTGGGGGDCPDCDGEGTATAETACRACDGEGTTPCPRGCTPP